MRKLAWILSAVTLLAVLSSCFMLPQPFSDPGETLKAAISEFYSIAKNYKDDATALASHLKEDFVKKYYYLDGSLSNYEGGKEAAAGNYAALLVFIIGFIPEASVTSFQGVVILSETEKDPEDIPSEIADKNSIEKLCDVTYEIRYGDDTEKYTDTLVKIAGKWYAKVLYYDSDTDQLLTWPQQTE